MKHLYPTILKYLEDQLILSVKDKRLLQLFLVYDTDIDNMLEASRPQNNEWAKWKGSDIEFIGPTFHKSFRQVDVLPTGQEDMEVWHALSENSEFWPALEEALLND